MKGRSIAFIGIVALVAVVSFAYASSLAGVSTSPSSNPTVSANGSQTTTLEDLLAGKYPTAVDKRGTGGVTVTVHNLRVLYVRTESDGDWHVGVANGNVPIFITEIIPADQQSEGKPPVGSTVDMTGVPYCDAAHELEGWHGNTCWELHPVKAWSVSSRSSSASGTVGTQASVAPHYVTISYGQNPIARGSTQTITIGISDSDGPVGGAVASIRINYASGYTVHNFSCTTSADGDCSVSWEIGPTSTPGTFNVTAEVDGQDFSSSFTVTL